MTSSNVIHLPDLLSGTIVDLGLGLGAKGGGGLGFGGEDLEASGVVDDGEVVILESSV